MECNQICERLHPRLFVNCTKRQAQFVTLRPRVFVNCTKRQTQEHVSINLFCLWC